MAFTRFHLSSYRTTDPELEKTLVDDVIKETRFWLNEFEFSDEQKDQTQILSGKVNRTKQEKGEFVVFAIIPLKPKQSFPAVWDARSLRETLGEDITLEVRNAKPKEEDKGQVNQD
jgi:hypothetical protein